MITLRKQVAALFVDRSCLQWLVRDPEGNFWLVPSEGELLAKYPELGERLQWFLDARPELCTVIHNPRKIGVAGRRLASILDETKLRRVLAKMLDENEFLSRYGLRSLSRYHADHPYVMHAGASHQTGWTGIIARSMHLFATLTPERALEAGKKAYSERLTQPGVAAPPVGR